MPTVWVTYPRNRKTEAIAAVRRFSAVRPMGRPARISTATSTRLLMRNRRNRNESGSICSSASLVAGKVDAQMTVVSARASCGMGSAPQHGGNEKAGQPCQHRKVDSDTDVTLPCPLPLLGIQRGLFQVPAFIIEPQFLLDFDEHLFRHQVPGLLLHDQVGHDSGEQHNPCAYEDCCRSGEIGRASCRERV